MIDAEERAIMEQTVRAALAEARASAPAGTGVDEVLAELGWRDMLADEPDAAIDVVFAALGATNASATALDDVLAGALGQTPRADLAVLLPGFATWAPPGRIADGALEARGIATRRAATAAELLVVAGTEEEPYGLVVPTTATRQKPVVGVDPDAGFHAVRVHADASAATRLDPAAWQAALALGRRAVATEIAGTCRAMLELARTHALERSQFGGPIARFQAVRHRLAEALVAVEALDSALRAARDEPGPETAALAKGVAGRSTHTVWRHCQQVLGGIGFTTEHGFHRYAKRALALEGILGSADRIALDVGRRILAERRVPTLIEL